MFVWSLDIIIEAGLELRKTIWLTIKKDVKTPPTNRKPSQYFMFLLTLPIYHSFVIGSIRMRVSDGVSFEV